MKRLEVLREKAHLIGADKEDKRENKKDKQLQKQTKVAEK